MCARRGIPVSNPSCEHLDICVSVLMPESGNRGKRARLSSRDSENRFLRVSEQVISLRALFLSLYLSLSFSSTFIRIERKRRGGGEREKREKEEAKEIKNFVEEEKEKVRRHPKTIFMAHIAIKSFDKRSNDRIGAI